MSANKFVSLEKRAALNLTSNLSLTSDMKAMTIRALYIEDLVNKLPKPFRFDCDGRIWRVVASIGKPEEVEVFDIDFLKALQVAQEIWDRKHAQSNP